MHPAMRVTPPEDPSAEPLSWGTLIEGIEQEHPAGIVALVYASDHPRRAYQAVVAFTPLDQRLVYVDPYTGNVGGATSTFNLKSFFRIFHKQFYILRGAYWPHGRIFVCVFSIVLLATRIDRSISTSPGPGQPRPSGPISTRSTTAARANAAKIEMARPVRTGRAYAGCRRGYHAAHPAREVGVEPETERTVAETTPTQSRTQSLRCRLVTPSASLVDDRATYVNVPMWDGLMGFSPGRAPIVGQLGLGELTITFAEKTYKEAQRSFMIEGGFAQMSGDELIVLAEHATPTEEITPEAAQKDMAEANAATVPDDAADPAAAAERLARRRERAHLMARIARRRK